MESSQFTDSQQHFESLEPMDSQGATCDTFRVKLYGKLHFLKRLKKEYAHDVRYQEALRKEFETGYRLEHPNLVRYVSFLDDGVLMEYIDGETLSQRLANHPEYFENRKNTEKFIHQLLDVVGYLHSHQVLHLDLKSDNILLTRINNDVKLIDLGCCYTDTFVDTQGRTNRFAAPEQLSGKQPDVRTDIYAIGCILESLPTSTIYNKVIARCTALNPSDRYQSIDELRKSLKPSHRRLLLSLLVALVLLLCLLSYYFLQHHSSRPAPELSKKPTTKQVPDSSKSVNKESPPVVVIKSTPNHARPQEVDTTEVVYVSESELTESQRLEIRLYALRVIRSVYNQMIVPVVNKINDGEYDERIGYARDSLSKVFVAANEEVFAIFRKDGIEKRYPHVSSLDVSEEQQNAIGDVMHYYNQVILHHQHPGIKVPPNPFEE